MENHAVERSTGVLAREYPCPKCGYDLRAAVGGRCPECGTVTRRENMVASRIPWAHRKVRGRVRGYWGTLRMIVRPRGLAREMAARQKRRDAAGFHRVSVWLALVILAGLGAGALKISGPRVLPEAAPENFAAVPAMVLTDTWWLAVPVGVGLWVSFRLAMAGYRGLLRMGVRGDIERRRAGMIGLYASGILPIEAVCWGLFLVGLAVANADWPARMNAVQGWFGFAGAGMALLGVGIYLILSLGLVVKVGRWKWLRGIAVVVYPLGVWVMTEGVVFAAVWLAGYVALAVRMMTV